MLVGGVRVHLVDHDPQAQRMRALDQPIEILERAEDRIDVAIVGDVVAEILHRRGEERRQPDAGDAERGDVAEALRDSGQIADPVAVRVREAVRIDLVDAARRATMRAGRSGLPLC